jgi:hypothetical protein
MVFASTMTKADDKVLQIWQSDGQVMTIKLSEEPKTSYADGETLTFTNLRPSTTIQLYNVAGQLLSIVRSDEQNKATVSVSRLPIGVYVVKVNGVTYKITKR